ncbi:BCCT family transporter [Microbacterium sediminicola]|uniref:BCCT family transporter n=1 Tax=Microbacterium sediminicola TaxID=415210 RepID=A0ABP4TQI7_9MICO
MNDPALGRGIHPALIPGIGVEHTGRKFSTNVAVFVTAGVLVLGVVIWALVAPENLSAVGGYLLAWETQGFGWLFSALAIVVLGFMLVVGYGRTGGIRLGADDEKPEFSTTSWVAMLFSAGMGIGLLFYGPLEPLSFFVDPPPGFSAAPETVNAMKDSLAQTIFHWGPFAWGFYALVGGAIAYGAYRRGRAPLISGIFEPLFGRRVDGWAGGVIDVFAIIVTLFGTAVSLGIGILQIGRGIEVIGGIDEVSEGLLIALLAILTGLFVLSAVSGVKRGIRALSNINMALAGLLALFVFVVGPTLLIVTMIPSGLMTFFTDLGVMLSRNGLQSDAAASFMASWTTYYWAWWISWSPFVGIFIAKISRGRTLREFVTVVILVPSSVCFVWFTILGSTAMDQQMQGDGVADVSQPEDVLFAMLGNLPLPLLTSIVAMISIIVYFVTSADSASIVMGSMSQRGKPEPSMWVTITWGLLLGAVGGSLLLAGGSTALGGLQSMMIVTSLPFAVIMIGMMVAWGKELRTDPYMLRRKFAQAAIAQGVRQGIAEHGDDFVFESTEVDAGEGAGAWLDTEDPELTEWYTTATQEISVVTAEDVERTLEPGHIQPKGPDRPDHRASGDAATVAERPRGHGEGRSGKRDQDGGDPVP